MMSLGQKAVAIVVGLLFAVLLLALFPWWLALFGLVAMMPFFFKLLTL